MSHEIERRRASTQHHLALLPRRDLLPGLDDDAPRAVMPAVKEKMHALPAPEPIDVEYAEVKPKASAAQAVDPDIAHVLRLSQNLYAYDVSNELEHGNRAAALSHAIVLQTQVNLVVSELRKIQRKGKR